MNLYVQIYKLTIILATDIFDTDLCLKKYNLTLNYANSICPLLGFARNGWDVGNYLEKLRYFCDN